MTIRQFSLLDLNNLKGYGDIMSSNTGYCIHISYLLKPGTISLYLSYTYNHRPTLC